MSSNVQRPQSSLKLIVYLALSNAAVINATSRRKEFVDRATFLQNWLYPEEFCSVSPEEDFETLLGKRFIDERTSYKTCDWFFDRQEYRRVTDYSRPSILWIKGRPGCGKSVLAAALVNRLRKESTESHVLYYFCHRHPEPTKSMELVRSLLAQAASWNDDEVLALLEEIRERQSNLDRHSRGSNLIEIRLWAVLQQLISLRPGKLQVVVDGIDECATGFSAITALLDAFVKAIPSSGPSPESNWYVHMSILLYALPLTAAQAYDVSDVEIRRRKLCTFPHLRTPIYPSHSP